MSARLANAPEHALAHGFARHVARWAHEGGAPESALMILRAAAYAASLATASGHVCVHLADIVEDPEMEASDAEAATIQSGPRDGRAFEQESMRRSLLESGMVGTPGSPASFPLILDDDGRLYLHRYFDYERRLAMRLRDSASHAPAEIGPEVESLLAVLFADNAARLAGRADWQKIATALALTRRLTIISGGPGTGKTTTMVKVLACALTRNPGLRVALAAPTGKAAARMLETIREAMAQLSPELRERLPGESFTVHRLLGVRPDSTEFRHHADNPLAIDLLVVDEASMLDLALATKLVEAVPACAHIVLLGDKDQLAAVESGAVFAELSADPTLSEPRIAQLSALTGIPSGRFHCASPLETTGLRDSVVWLTENFRFAKEGGIGRLAASINAGQAASAVELLRSRSDPALEWIEDASPVPQPETLQRILLGMDNYVDALKVGLSDPAALLRALARFRVLCAEREGPRGAAEINRVVSRHVRMALGHPLDPGLRSDWYPGRPVMVLRNDYVLKLFNGDIGIALPDASGNAMVHFPESDGSFRAIVPLRLPEHETAYATTVHKAQGSEFDDVLLLLPSAPVRVVTRELLYTAVTRARARVTIVGGSDVLEKAVATPTRRHSGLVARMRELDRGDSPRASSGEDG